MSRRHGFTLLEILLAIVIGMLIISLAVPGVVGMLRQQDLHRTFESFDDFVHAARSKSVMERRDYIMVFDEAGVTLQPADPKGEDADTELERFAFEEGHVYTLDRPVALMKKPAAQWPFWRSGCCEPVRVLYEGPAGTWVAEYNALTATGAVVEEIVK